MEELNKKLAEWAGFTKADIKKRYYFTIGGERVPKWYPPDSEYSDKLPNFPNSLDACFKWLVPEYEKRYGIYAKADLLCKWLDLYENNQRYKDKPALALCKAIEKLIDSEEVKQ